MQDNFLYATHVHYFGYQGKGNNSDDSTDRTTASQDQEGTFISTSEQIIFTAPNKSPKISVLALRCQDIGTTIYSTTGSQDIPMFVKVYVGKGKVGYGPRFLLAVVPVTLPVTVSGTVNAPVIPVGAAENVTVADVYLEPAFVISTTLTLL